MPRLLEATARALLLAAALAAPAGVHALEVAPPDFARLEKAGAVIGEIRVLPRNIFDPSVPGEDHWLYLMVNRLHPVTRPAVIERMLLFRSGEPVSVKKLDETERLLRTLRIIHDVEFLPVGYDGKKVDIEVITRDTWTLDVTGSYSRAGGDNKSKFGLKDRNVLGTGLSLAIGRTSEADRRGTELDLEYRQAFDGWTRLAYSGGRYDDGRRNALSIDRPFYAFDTRRAAGASWSDDDRIDPIYNAGDVVSEYRHRARQADLYAGWSPGLVAGWTHRYSAGFLVRDDAYRAEPGRTLAVPLPINHDVRAPFVRYEVLEDDFAKVKNHDRIARTEFLRLGFSAYVQLARSLRALDSDRSDWLFAAGVGDGTTLASGWRLLGQASIDRRIGSTATPLTQYAAAGRIYAPRSSASLWYASLSLDRVSGGGVADQLLLGGTEGLRGYPSRYQAGENRVIATLEKRFYSDWYPWRLARVGGAVFADTGRAWGGPNQNLAHGGWLTDVGAGLRIAIDRAAFNNVLHLDIAVPLDRPTGKKAVQFLVKTEVGF